MDSETIKKLRKMMNMSQREFGNALGVTVGSVCRWEAGKIQPSNRAKNLILDALEAINGKNCSA